MTTWIVAIGSCGGWGVIDSDDLATRLVADDGSTYLVADNGSTYLVS